MLQTVPLTLDQLDRMLDYDGPVKVFDIPPGHDAVTMDPPTLVTRVKPTDRRIRVKFFKWEAYMAAHHLSERLIAAGDKLVSLTLYYLPDGRAALLAFVVPPCPSLGSMGGGSQAEMKLQDEWEKIYGSSGFGITHHDPNRCRVLRPGGAGVRCNRVIGHAGDHTNSGDHPAGQLRIDWPAWNTDGSAIKYEEVKCMRNLRAAGQAYPRTCEVCGLGPCSVHPTGD
jgi:hypothetical protein